MVPFTDNRSIFLALTFFIASVTPFYIYYIYSLSYGTNMIQNTSHGMELRGFRRHPIYRKSLTVILLWNGLYQDRSWTGLAEKRLARCNCFVTRNRSHFEHAQLVVFHWRNIDEKDLPSVKPSGQLWIWMLTESPIYTFQTRAIPRIGRLFDCWASYRKDSDFVLDYARFVETNQSSRSIDEISLTSKNKSVAWMVSHCNSNSGRDEYAKQLSRYIGVDIYGECGKLKCGEYNSFKYTSCYQLVERDYKFYLSFENSICKDYVTEKAFNWLNYNVIPIVFGGADYAQIMPNHSYINALDFGSPKELAQYLKKLSTDEKSYRQYFDWKKSGLRTQLRIPENYADVFCEIVEQVRFRNQSGKTVCNRSGQDLYKWWFDDAHCQSWIPTKGLVPVRQFNEWWIGHR